jgi:type I restriction enzyme R subunit
MTEFTESTVEAAALAWLEAAGWQVAHGPNIAHGTAAAEWADYRKMLQNKHLRVGLCPFFSSPASFG